MATLGSFLGEAVVAGATLLLTGEPGVGKTALLVAAAELAATDGVRVIRGGGVEYETDVSFAGLHQLVDLVSDDLRRLPPSSRASIEVALGIGSGPAPDRLAVLSASLALFRLAASTTPLLIVIDDLHWLDRASGAVVGFVGRRLRGSRIGLLGAIRPGVGGFFERAGLPEFHVAPLEEADAMTLLTRRFVHLPTRVRRGVVDEAQGNPLALLEFAALAGGADAGGSGMSREVRGLYEARIERLPDATRRLLLLAVLDASGDLGVLAAAGGSEGLDDLGPAERDHLVVVDGRSGAVRFRHPLIKSVVVEHSTHDQRRAAHLRLAELFADQPERRGHHLAEAALAPDEEVAAAVDDGAHRTLQRGDVVGAISRLLRAADLSPNPRDRGRRLADAAYVGARSAGQLDSSSELLRDAHRRDPSLAETLHAAVATAYLLLNSDGNAQTTHQLLTVAIESALGEPECLRALMGAEPHYARALSGFEAIDHGRRVLEDRTASARARRTADDLIWKGNVELLEHEQRTLVQPNLDRLSCAFARLFSIGSALTFEVRGVRQEASYFTSFYLYSLTRGIPQVLQEKTWPRITRFDDRWRWIVTSIVPRFQRFDADTRLADASLRRIFDEARDYASNPCVTRRGSVQRRTS